MVLNTVLSLSQYEMDLEQAINQIPHHYLLSVWLKLAESRLAMRKVAGLISSRGTQGAAPLNPKVFL